MKLVHNWTAVLKRAWSVRFIVLGGAINGVAAVFPEIVGELGLSPSMIAALGAVVAAAAAVARVVKQEDMED
jgi:hypothetical protein